MNETADISIVIPVLDDSAPLAVLVAHLRDMRTQPREIIVVDGGDDRELGELAARFDCTCLHARTGRGNQLHAGALHASGEAIWFLHADSEPAPDSIDRIAAALAGGAIGGFFSFRFSGPHAWYKSLLAALVNLRCAFGVPYGDQGLFILKSVYCDIGGFADVPLFEEVAFVNAARRAGRFERIDAPLGVSPRRWERDGWLRRTLQNRSLALAHAAGVSPSRLARRYPRESAKGSAKC
jgi:rSAM/selenodomain-associated transferase 2